MEEKIIITSIQRFSLHDGPGIRTTVFLKGCSLRCPWCSNPENFEKYPEEYIKDGVRGIYGKIISENELIEECLKDQMYYGREIRDSVHWQITKSEDIEHLPGGVTFSGGEPLLQLPIIIPVISKLHEEKIHIAVETSLFAPEQNVLMASECIDFFFIDVKILDKKKCNEIEHGKLELFINNLDIVMRSDKPVVIRIPVIGHYTDMQLNRMEVKELLNKFKKRVLKIELIKEHNLGESKYKSLNLPMVYTGVTNDLMMQYKRELSDLNIPIEICSV